MTFDQPPFIAHSTEVARDRIFEMVREHQAAGGGPVTVLWCTFGTGSLNAIIEATDVLSMLSDMDRMAAETGLGRDKIKDALIEGMRTNQVMEGDGREAAPQIILWLLCRGPKGAAIERVARRGGGVMGYEISMRKKADGDYANFRTVVQSFMFPPAPAATDMPNAN